MGGTAQHTLIAGKQNEYFSASEASLDVDKNHKSQSLEINVSCAYTYLSFRHSFKCEI